MSMKLLGILLFLVLFSISIIAQEISYKRIYIGYTLEKKYIDSIYAILHPMDIPIYIEKKDKRYNIYSQKYLIDDAKIKDDLKTIQTKFKNAKILIHQKTEDDHFQLNLSVGSSRVHLKQNYDLNKKFILNYEVALSYLLTQNTSFSFAYLDSSQEEITIENIYLGLNYTFYPMHNFYILLGLLGGYSNLEFDNAKNTKKSTSTLFGLKNKFGYKLNENLDIFIQYNGIYFDHVVYVEDSLLHINFNYINNITVGLGMKF